jgi:uncharacterized protein DUF3226
MIRQKTDATAVFYARNCMVVEGDDDSNGFEAMLAYVGRASDLEIFVANGKTRIRATLQVLSGYSGFEALGQVIVVRDPDDDPTAAFASCADSLVTIGFTRPRGVDVPALTSGRPDGLVWLTPMTGRGSLETLCFSSLTGTAVETCVESYLKCMDGTYELPKVAFNDADQSKRRTEAVLAAGRLAAGKDEPGLPLGLGLRRGLFDLTSPVFSPYLDRLRSLP